ncbi:MAG: ribosome biogenesis GTP-binding protein YihA/YsxC [Pseudomonadota bacterium]
MRSCHTIAQLPAVGPPEIAFAGRSNVGKSSLINALVGQKGLAKASNTPGRTRALNLFARQDGIGPLVVDMPGYGYARASKSDVETWTALVFDYLRGRPGLVRVYLLVDARHGIKPGDENAMSVLDTAAVSYQVVLTKADKTGRSSVRDDTIAKIKRRPAAYPAVLLTSASKGEGIAQLRAEIATVTGATFS